MFRVDLGPLTEVRGAPKEQVRQRFRDKQKVPGSLSQGRVPLTKKARRLRSYKKKAGVD